MLGEKKNCSLTESSISSSSESSVSRPVSAAQGLCRQAGTELGGWLSGFEIYRFLLVEIELLRFERPA